MTSDRILQLSAAVEAMPEGPSRQRFSALLAELSEAEGVPTSMPSADGPDGSDGSDGSDGLDGSAAEEWSPEPASPEPASPEPSSLEGLLGGVTTVPAVEAPDEEPKRRRWRRSS